MAQSQSLALALLAVLLVALAAAAASPLLPLDSSATAPRTGGLPQFDRSARGRPGRLALADAVQPPLHERGPAARARAPREDQDADPYRLPTALRPVHYKVSLTPHLSGNFSFEGNVEIRFNAIEATNKIVLHAKQIAFGQDDCSLFWDSAEEGLMAYGAVTGVTFDKASETATLYIDATLHAGMRYALFIDNFTGVLNDDLDGFYRSSYKTSSGETRWLATTQFEPTGARRAFPCWDEPGFKSRYDIVIRHDAKLTALSNLPRLPPDTARGSGVSDDGMVEDSFTTTLPMSSYLVAFVVSDFESVTNADGTFTTWARQDIVAGAALSQEVGPRALKALAEFNGVDYSLTKMDQAAIPDFAAGAMENWGLVTYKENYLIVKPETTTKLRERIATAICHEFGHQWTGDLVTLDWWEHTWLNEGFASFYESMICAQVKPEWNLEDKMVPAFYHVAMESDVRETQVPLSAPVHAVRDQIEERFGIISYNKGGSVLRMFYHALTPDVFKKAMKRYLSDYMFHNTNPGLLFKAFNAEIELSALHQIPKGVTFAEVASTWTEQAGVPVLKAVRDYKTGTVSFSQQRFLYAPVTNASLLDQQWFIPLVVTSQAKPDFDTTTPQSWLSPGVHSASLPSGASADQWVLVNPKQTGYFRVNYDETNWKLLAAALAARPSDIHAASRAQLLNDALTLARAGQLDYQLALPFLPPLRQERSVTVWQAAVTALDYLLARLDNTDASDALLWLIKDSTAAAYDELGYKVADSEDHEKAFLRYYVASYACRAGNARCLSDAASALAAWLADPASSPLQPDTRDTSLCFGVRGSGAATFEAMRKAWQAQTDADTKYTYASALACSKDQSLLRGLLKDAVAKKYSALDGVDVFNAAYDHTWNHGLLLDFVKKNADAMQQAFGNNFDVQVLGGIIRDIRTRKELEEVRSWAEAKYKSQDSWRALEQALAAAELELSTWFDKYYAGVAAWLQPSASTASPRPTTAAPRPTTGGPTTPSHEATTAGKGGATTAAASAAGLVLALLCAALLA